MDEDGCSRMGRSGFIGDVDRFERCLEVVVNRIYRWVWWYCGKELLRKIGGLGVCSIE